MTRDDALKRAKRLQSETGAVIKHGRKEVSVVLVYPNTYFVAMSNLGFQLVYRLLNERDDLLCERAFLPDREDLAALEKSGRKLTSLESGRPLSDFDIIAFSVPFENDYPNILSILSLSNIPFYSSERDERYPLILSGGVTAFLNPEPLADFMDLFAIGEGEELIPDLMDSYMASKEEGRKELLKKLSNVEGLYVPSLYNVSYNEDGTIAAYEVAEGGAKRIKRRWLAEEELETSATGSAIITDDTEFGGMHLVEVGRGCGRGCRFCAAGYIYLPPRERSVEALQEEFDKGISDGHRIGLISPSLADHSGIDSICSVIAESDGATSLSSIRADGLKESFLENIRSGGQKTVTIAPEAGTERMRNVINKGLADEDILKAVSMLAKAGIPNIRFYFMIGLPSERDEDIEGIIDISRKCRDLFVEESKVHGTVGKITLSVNSFVPKPFTPFQWHPMEDEKSLKNKIKRIKKELGREPNITVINDVPKWAHIQGLLSRGDRRMAGIIEAVYKNDGDWKKTIKEGGLDVDFYTTRERDKDEVLPWEILDMGIEKNYLWKEYERGLAGKYTPPCNVNVCTRCGVC
ncbi:MAG: TIGR03960 family B12-binding radical SAM protein [Proteobacteria bacterium]|nr:TIGR03960 family B12-binding radical SAM protein [Pseudomonadota bacterium]